MKHRLTNKDKVGLVADCSICGPKVPIRLNGRYGIVCVEARRQADARFKEAHPERVRQMKKRPPSAHRLTKRDGSPDTCAICGPVTPRAVGRGYGCPNRLDELGRKTIQLAPQPQCPLCKRYLDRYGACPKCDDDLSDLDTKYMPLEARGMKRFLAQFEEIPEGFSIVKTETPLPPDNESAVHGWKTIGGPAPSADEWMRANGHKW